MSTEYHFDTPAGGSADVAAVIPFQAPIRIGCQLFAGERHRVEVVEDPNLGALQPLRDGLQRLGVGGISAR
jgi:hypothetical protein